jgi:hypothetical protein
MEESTSKVSPHIIIRTSQLKPKNKQLILYKIYAAHPPYGKSSNQIGNIPHEVPLTKKTKNSPIHTVTTPGEYSLKNNELMIHMYTHNSVNIHKNKNEFTIHKTSESIFLENNNELTIHTNTQVNILQEPKGTHNSHYNP